MENTTSMENPTNVTKNSTVGNSTAVHPTTEIEELELSGIIIVLIGLLGYILSSISMVIHLYKFYRSKQKQNLQIKNLTNYCFCLLILYSFILVTATGVSYNYPNLYEFVDLYLHVTVSILLLIMASYTCLCIIISQKAYHLPLSDDRQFLIYSLIGWVFPILIVVIYVLLGSPLYLRVGSILSIRLLATVPFFISLWCIRSIGWNRTNIIKNFVIHLRLIILTGVISIIPNTIYGILLLFDREAVSTSVFARIAELLYLWEGFIVGLCFTFRKGTFENVNANPIEMANGYVTEIAQVAGDRDEE